MKWEHFCRDIFQIREYILGSFISFFLIFFFKVHSSFSYEIIPILVTEIFHETPGMAGLFIAGLFCASLRSRRACLLVLTFVLVKIVYEWRISVKNSFYWFVILITFYFET